MGNLSNCKGISHLHIHQSLSLSLTPNTVLHEGTSKLYAILATNLASKRLSVVPLPFDSSWVLHQLYQGNANNVVESFFIL